MKKKTKKEKERPLGWSIASLPLLLQVACFGVVVLALYTQSLSTDMTSILLICIVLGAVLNAFGEALPVWNKYIGGGILMAFFGTALLQKLQIVPPVYTKAIHEFVSGETGFLTFLIVLLITGSILSFPPHILVKSTAFFFPAILGGIVCAALLGVGAGALMGHRPIELITHYVLPIMGGGNGGGAVPLSQIYQEATGRSSTDYYGFVIVILTLANVLCIIAGAVLNVLGDKYPRWTGDKKSLFPHNEGGDVPKETAFENKDIGTAFLLALVCYAFGRLFSAKILPTIFGVRIHHFAYMILFVVLLVALGFIPPRVGAAANKLQQTMTQYFAPVIMVGLGLEFDLNGLGEVLTFSNFFIIFMVVLGAIMGSGFVGMLFGLYPIDAAITAGLCMANRGGSGDLAVLGASQRMGLLAFAQLSSCLGGGLILILASFIFPLGA